MKQCAAGIRSIGNLDGIENKITGVRNLIGASVYVREGSGNSVESRVSDALVTVIKILTTRAYRTVLQLAKLHLLTSLAGIAARALTPKIVPCHMTRAVVVARTAYAHVV